MKIAIDRRLWGGLIALAIALIGTVVYPPASWASSTSGNQIFEQPANQQSANQQSAILVGPRADAPIPIYLRPAANQPNVGYGVNGDSVVLLEQLASFLPEADKSSAWNHIRLESAPYTEGWIQGKFLRLPAVEGLAESEGD